MEFPCPTDALVTRIGSYYEVESSTSYDPVVETVTTDNDSLTYVFGAGTDNNISATTMERGLMELFGYIGKKKHKTNATVIPKRNHLPKNKGKGKVKGKAKGNDKIEGKNKAKGKAKLGGIESSEYSSDEADDSANDSSETDYNSSSCNSDDDSNDDFDTKHDVEQSSIDNINILEYGSDEPSENFDIMNFADTN